MATTQLDYPPAQAPAPRLPRLENGDRLTRAEFERRYEAMAEVKKAELIEGIVHMPSPVRIDVHGQPHGSVVGWLVAYCAATPGVQWGDNTTVRLDLDNEFQPDALLRIEASAGGQSRVTEGGYVEGAPELVVEVAASTVSIDRHAKLNAYRRNGVREYLIWEVLDRQVEWFALQDGEFVPLAPDDRGVIHSRVFPGLRLAVDALLEGKIATVLSEQQMGLAASEHREFVGTLEARSRR
jgi:Uma2 family endonuclease